MLVTVFHMKGPNEGTVFFSGPVAEIRTSQEKMEANQE
jgi:hypothetical protein